MRYPNHRAFVAPARQQPALWRLILGLALVIAVHLVPAVSLANAARDIWGSARVWPVLSEIGSGNTPLGLILLLASFSTLILGTWLAARILQGRGFVTLTGPLPDAIADFRRCVIPLAAFMLLAMLFTLWSGEAEQQFSLPALLPWLPLALPALIIQTGAEEILFRGYIQQQLAARFDHPAIWMGVPSLLFALGHFDTSVYGANAIAIALWAALFGLLAADLTARSGTLGAAVAFHFANNLGAMILVGVEGDMSGLALYTMSLDLSDPASVIPLLAVDFATMLIGWLICRVALRL